MMTARSIAVSVQLLLLMATPLASAQDSDSGDCVNIRTISSWSALSDRHLYIKAPGAKNHYFVTLWQRCPGLQFAQALAFANHRSRLCSNDFGEIAFRDGDFPRTCLIDDIERVNSRDEAKALAEAAKNARDDEAQAE